MKKKISLIAAALVCLALTLTAAACNGGETEITNRLDVQEMWEQTTGKQGYPQASLVVKAELAQSSPEFVKAFYAALWESDGWAEANPQQAEAAVAAHMEEGAQTTLKNITADIVKRCNIKIVPAADAKAATEEFLAAFLEMEDETGNSIIGGKLPAGDFYYSAGSGGSSPDRVKVFMPDGATSLALAGLMNAGGQIGDTAVDYTVVTANTIASKLTTGQADIAVVPTNVAAKLYNATGKYVMAASVTHGNLYIVGGDMTGLDSIKGGRLGVIGRGAVPDIVLRYLLKKNSVEFVVSDTAVGGKVALSYFADGAGIIKAFKAGKIDFGLLGEPAATTALDAFPA